MIWLARRAADPSGTADFLASGLVRDGWSLKALHREIVLSATYRQASAGMEISSDVAELYVSFPRRRLTAEEIRDSLLVASGELDRAPGEAHPFPPQEKWNFTQHGPFAAEYQTPKRSVYLMQKRNRRNAFFALFDGADRTPARRYETVTTVPTQALFFLNDRSVHGVGRQVVTACATAPRRERAARLCMSRVVLTPGERADLADASAFLQDYAARLDNGALAERARAAWQAYARVLLASNEFLCID